MSAAVTLLSAVLDSDGYICIIGLRGKGSPPLQTFYAPGEFKQAVGRANWLDSQGYDAYFGTATFVDRSSRQASNAHTAKNFKLDLDIAPDDDRKFPSQSAAIAALKQFCKANALPKPTVVSSGWGIHVYWPVTQAMHPADAKLYADKLKALCHARGFKASPESTSDIARVLRVPGTHNHKVENNVREVQLLNEPTLCDTKSLMDAIDAACVDLPAPVAAAYVSTALFPGQELPAHLRGVSLDEHTQDLFQGAVESIDGGQGVQSDQGYVSTSSVNTRAPLACCPVDCAVLRRRRKSYPRNLGEAPALRLRRDSNEGAKNAGPIYLCNYRS
jgi:hypothetical protein